MRFKKWHGVDYRTNSGTLREYNLIGRVWNLRLVLPFGISIWRNYAQKFRLNYPAL